MKKTDPVDLSGKKPAVVTMVAGDESTAMSLKKGQKIRLVWSADGPAEQTDEGEFYGADGAKKELTYYRKAGMYKTLSFDDLVRVEVIAEYSESGPLDY